MNLRSGGIVRVKPLLTKEIKTKHTSFDVNLSLDNNVTFIQGDSGVGKSAVYSFIEELSVTDKRLKCLNYLDINKGYKNQIKQSKGKLFVIDNADILLDDALRGYIAFDSNNQYVIIGRNPKGLQINLSEVYKLVSSSRDGRTLFEIERAF